MYLSDFGGAILVGGGAMTSLKCTKFVHLLLYDVTAPPPVVQMTPKPYLTHYRAS